ncbi:YhgE/Pip domain-containing protein [Streptomyces sp. P38-E01]|uniref:YhgE/Pip domain-containing protein n=1 Tax=Streptomyces tardus TaxID=2780544 RepID=A0A949N6Y2_9ACTN|nr:YhgE/Pip domain-containing protein [Streptomyces tardus]MBU7599542.1 YhgE/Pip domain-containing protein [Streptomyces tardus]
MRSPRLAALELKRFGRGRMPRAAVAAMLLIPLLYGALYLWSFWDPLGSMDRIPVALVNDDRGAHAESDDGKRQRIQAGEDIVSGLHDSDTFDWQEVGAEEAEKGVEDGSYYLSLTIPADFSAKLASSSGENPETGALRVRTNDANNYIVGQISRTVFSEVRASASSKASDGFFNRIFVSFSTLHERTGEAADGAGRINKGVGDAKDGTKELLAGAGRAQKGSGELHSGVTKLHKGAATLHSGTKQVAGGTKKLAAKVNGLAKAVEPLTSPEAGEDIAKLAGRVAKGAKAAQKHVGKLPEDAERAEKLARGAANGAEKLHNRLCGEESSAEPAAVDCSELEKHVQLTRRAADAAEGLNDRVQEYEDLDELRKDLVKVERTARQVQQRAPHLGKDLDTAVKQVNALDAGARKVNAGAGRLHTGLGTAKSGSSQLDSGLSELSAGVKQLDGGLFKLADGSQKLAKGLDDGKARIPDYGDDERAERSSIMADPVDLQSRAAHQAPNYGTGFAPYFIPLALWVAAMICYMLLPALNRRALAAGAPSWRTALAGWLPVVGLGLAQVVTLISVLHWGLGLQMERPAGTVGFLLLTTACFSAIVQWMNARFGPAGRIVVLVALMLQLTSAGGTYPVQTSPDFFNAIHPYLPMTYVVDGLRVLITGGAMTPVWQACGVLLGFTAGALALTAFTARRGAVWTMKRLHPELTL